MSPSRPNSLRRNSSGCYKPYTRCSTPVLGCSTPEVKQEADFVSLTSEDGSPPLPAFSTPPRSGPQVFAAPHATPTHVERPGFPSYAQYKQVEAGYIQSLTPRRQGKALITQAMFDRIWDVLHNPESPGETAQFRFWARKMFTTSKTYRSSLGGIDPNEPLQEVLLHDNLLVAIQEQIYDLLCFCHGSTGHGGRDKTCALIRKHYTWVPKDLVSSFIKACPTCIMKKCGTIDSAALVSQMAEDVALGRIHPPQHFVDAMSTPSRPGGSPLAGLGSPGIPWPHLPSPTDSPTPPSIAKADPLEAAYREAVMRGRHMKSGLAGLGMPSTRVYSAAPPMAREVSLYKGLPNGWQYRHDNYNEAYAEFMNNRESLMIQQGDLGVHDQRPRVPSILPFWGPEQFADQDERYLQDAYLGDTVTKNAQSGSQFLSPDFHALSQLSPFMLVDQLQAGDNDANSESQSFLPQIDPHLLELSMAPSAATPYDEDIEDQSIFDSPRKRAIPRLHLDLSPGRLTGQSFAAYREANSGTSLIPDSPSPSSTRSYALKRSPTGSDSSSSSSGSSQLSRFCRPGPLSAASTISPGSSALPTPIEERSNMEGKDSFEKDDTERKIQDLTSSIIKGKLRVVSDESVDITLSGNM